MNYSGGNSVCTVLALSLNCWRGVTILNLLLNFFFCVLVIRDKTNVTEVGVETGFENFNCRCI